MNPKPGSLRRLSLAAALCGFSLAVIAQSVPTPGQVQEQLRSRPSLPATPSTPVTPAESPTAASGVPPGGKAVLVERFEISGNQSIATEELQQVVAPYQGRAMTLLEVYEVADLLTRYYRTHGYALATANVPAQKIGSGVVQLEVLEGNLGNVSVEGNKHYRSNFVQWQLDGLQPGAPLRNEPLEREMLLLNDLPGLDARAVLRPGDQFGTSDLVVAAEEKPVDAGLRYNNYGRESIGQERFEGNVALNGLMGIGDRLDFSGVYAEADLLHYGRLGYSVPISPWGTRASVYYASYDYEVDSKKLRSTLSQLDIDGEGDNFGVNIQHPFWRSRTKNLYLGIGFDRTVTDQIESTFGSRTKQNLSLGVFTALFDYIAPDRSYSTLGGTFSTNFNSADLVTNPATGGLTVEDNAQTAKLQLDLSHYRSVYKQLSFYGRLTGVISADSLHDLERFRLGGPNNVRAYASSEISGDSGFFFSGELQHPLQFEFGAPVIVKAFFDTGRVYRKHHNLLGVEHAESLSGVGVGLQASAFRKLLLDFMVAQPVGAYDTTDSNRGARVWFSLSANF
jgi:hemolysin activation/secretion protein